MRNMIVGFIAAVITGGLMLITFSPVTIISQNVTSSAPVLYATSNTSAYVSSTGNVERYQDIQIFLLENFWWIICMIILIVVVIMISNIGKDNSNG
jgi:hypothetical protein